MYTVAFNLSHFCLMLTQYYNSVGEIVSIAPLLRLLMFSKLICCRM